MLGLLPGRVTYVIDREGTVRYVLNSMTNISQHVSDALAEVRKLQAGGQRGPLPYPLVPEPAGIPGRSWRP